MDRNNKTPGRKTNNSESKEKNISNGGKMVSVLV